jgi:CelD/BcsL family acetyltransferase involved in cellulose biosynthesis
MPYSVSIESLDSLISSGTGQSYLKWDPIFILPAWLKAWWRAFGAAASLLLYVIKQGDTTIGVAPLKVVGGVASFIGDSTVCDYLDFVVTPGKERGFFTVLLDTLDTGGVNRLDLAPLRPESTVLASLAAIARERHYRVSCNRVAVSLELDLPETWDDYLETLSGKQRHEVKRKLRRFNEMGRVNFRISRDSQAIPGDMELFLKLFRESRQEKAGFMNAPMRAFFESLAEAMAGYGLLRLGFLELDSAPVATVMYFDYNDRIYLYNSGYDPAYSWLSVGLLAKVLCLKDSIIRKKRKFDFLKGAEVYKYRLGGSEIPLYSCQIALKAAGV